MKWHLVMPVHALSRLQPVGCAVVHLWPDLGLHLRVSINSNNLGVAGGIGQQGLNGGMLPDNAFLIWQGKA